MEGCNTCLTVRGLLVYIYIYTGAKQVLAAGATVSVPTPGHNGGAQFSDLASGRIVAFSWIKAYALPIYIYI